MILASALTGAYMVGGLALSYKPNLPTGATIIIVAGIVYLLVLVLRPSHRRIRAPKK
jgi:zinc transport system permease protein